MADIEDELDSLFDDSSLNDEDIDDFLKMVDEDDAGAEDVFADTEDDEEESSFVSADLDADGDVDSFDIMNDWNEMSDNDKASESGSVLQKPDKVDDEAEEGSFTDIDNLFTGIDEDADAPEPLPKETLFQKIKKLFSKKELTEEQRIAKEAEEAEEAEYEERINAQKAEKKKAKDDAKAAAKEEAAKKKQEKAAAATAKKAEAAKKKQEKAAKKAAKKAEAAGGPIPKSQLVPVAPLSAFIIVGIAMAVVVILGSETRFYSATVKDSKELFVHQKYSNAYQNLLGLKIKDKDKEFYDQVETVNLIDDKLSSYNSYMEINRYEEGLNSLIEGVRAYNEYSDRAEQLGLLVEFNAIYEQIATQLNDKFDIGIQQANELLNMTLTEYNKNIMSIARKAEIADGLIDEAEITDEDNQ